jgi:hypothetical protein
MNGARFILLLLWPVLWLGGSVHAQGATARWVPAATAQSRVYSASQQSSASSEFQAIHHRAMVRVHRRADFRPVSIGSPDASSLFQNEISRCDALFKVCGGSLAPPGLANGWQFLWRTASIPRAPSLVS